MSVWTLFGRKSDEWGCLQVAQKSNRDLHKDSMGCEIVADIDIMFLSRRFAIYQDIVARYDELAFLCINRQEGIIESQNDAKNILATNKLIECEYAQRHQVIYFHDIKFCFR